MSASGRLEDLKVLVLYANCMMDNLIPVGVSCLIGALREAGMQVKLFDTTFYRTEERPSDLDRVENLQVAAFDYSDAGLSLRDEDYREAFRSEMLEFNPDLLMVSMVESTFEQARQMLLAAGEERPLTLAGGVMSILSPQTVADCELIDAVCIGEGETAAVEFCRRYSAGDSWQATPGMWVKRDSELHRNAIESLVDLDAAPLMDFSLYEKARFFKPMQGRIFRMVPVEFSRGCPYNCSYCANHALAKRFRECGRWYRWKTMDRIFREIETYVSKYGAEFFYFVSESFLSMPAEKFEEFCRRYSEYRTPFWFNTRPETLNPEVVRKLEDIGCFRMGIGLEHGNEEFRRKMLNRRVTNQQIVDACRAVEQSGISYSINNILGFPGETREQVFDTIRLNREINPDSVGTFVFTPFRGTDLYDYCLEHGYVSADDTVGDLNRGSVLRNNTLNSEAIKGLLRTFPLYVDLDENRWPEIERAEVLDEEGNATFKALAEEYTTRHFGGGK